MDLGLQWLQAAAGSPHVQTLSVVVTAIATIVLAVVTWVLAKETKVLSRATSQAQVTVTLEPNQWAPRYVDIVVANSGNAVAYDIEVEFDPSLPKGAEAGGHRSQLSAPLQRISILRPAQTLQSSLCQFSAVSEKEFRVAVSWRIRPRSKRRETLTYLLSMADYTDVSYLGARSPFTQIADEMKKLREDWRYVASGRKRVAANVYSSEDRDLEKAQKRELYDRLMEDPEQAGDTEGGDK